MKTAIIDLINGYESYVGASKIIPLFLVSLLAICLFDLYGNNDKRRRINPAVFLLSVWSGIAYAMTLCIKKPMKRSLTVFLFLLMVIVFSGNFIFAKDNIPYSVYYYTPGTITIISIVSILAFFVMYFLIATQLFENNVERLIFIAFVLLLHLFADYSDKSLYVSVFLYPISIPSVVIHDLMPFTLWVYLLYERNKPIEQTKDEDLLADDDYEEEWDMKKHKIINIRNMAIAFALLLVVVGVCVFSLNSKINNLYNATVALEEATKGKVSLYEFIPDGQDFAAATLMISGDGKVTVCGGGSAENGQELYKFISEYTTNVNSWYLYGDGDDNRGAFEHCLNSGITVDKCYYLNVEEIE